MAKSNLTAKRLPLTADKKGVALVLTFIFMTSLIVVVGAYLFMVSYDTRHAATQGNNVKALYLAESAVNHAVYYLTNTAPDGSIDGSWRTTAYPAAAGSNPTDPQQRSLGDGTYTMWVETSGSDVLVTGRGTVAGINRTIQETITIASGDIEAFDYAQYSGDDIEFNGASGTVTGNIAAVGTVDNEGGMTITGSITESSGVIAPAVDTSEYQAIATTTVSGNYTFSAGTYSGIYYIDGRATINDNVTVNGTIVATDNIVLTNTDNFRANPTGDYPALVSDATITGNRMGTAIINGLVFAAASISLPRGTNNTVNGSLISAGDIDLNSGTGWAITYDADLASDPPPYFSAGTGGTTGDGWVEL